MPRLARLGFLPAPLARPGLSLRRPPDQIATWKLALEARPPGPHPSDQPARGPHPELDLPGAPHSARTHRTRLAG